MTSKMYNLIDKTSRFDTVVLAAGDFPTNPIALEILKANTPLIVCDSALEEVVAYNDGKAAADSLHPSAVVGDGDSLHPKYKEQFKGLWHQVSEQDDNDLTKSTKFAIANYSPKSVAFIGATGKREDHTIGNIALMHYYFDHLGISPYMITDYGYFVVARGDSEFESVPRQQVSVFNCGCKSLSSEGLKWGTFAFDSLWEGTLNEATGTKFRLHGDADYLVYRTFEIK